MRKTRASLIGSSLQKGRHTAIKEYEAHLATEEEAEGDKREGLSGDPGDYPSSMLIRRRRVSTPTGCWISMKTLITIHTQVH